MHRMTKRNSMKKYEMAMFRKAPAGTKKSLSPHSCTELHRLTRQEVVTLIGRIWMDLGPFWDHDHRDIAHVTSISTCRRKPSCYPERADLCRELPRSRRWKAQRSVEGAAMSRWASLSPCIPAARRAAAWDFKNTHMVLIWQLWVTLWPIMTLWSLGLSTEQEQLDS